ncbi:MAG: aldose epimerase family protein [Acidimicrobiales bacterium]
MRGEEVLRYIMVNSAGTQVAILTLGGIIESLLFADRRGERRDIVLGFGSLAEYVRYNPARNAANPQGAGAYFGALVGRYANRIAGGRLEVDGQLYCVPTNDGTNALHGGDVGFDQKVWGSTVVQADGAVGVRLEYVSPSGEMGFPGTLRTVATYTLDNDNRLVLELQAETDAATFLNLTNHTYWNLAGESSGTVYDHLLYLNADFYTPVDGALAPTGEVLPVSGTPLDFRQPRTIGERIRDAHPQMTIAHGYDHNWVLGQTRPTSLLHAATVVEPKSGRALKVLTTQPGLQFYSGNFLNGALVGKRGCTYRQSDGFALEAQHFPGSPHWPDFPSTALLPGDIFEETIVFELTCDP